VIALRENCGHVKGVFGGLTWKNRFKSEVKIKVSHKRPCRPRGVIGYQIS
jgi:hypothetical protein